MAITRVQDSFGRPVEFKREWKFEGHRARTDAEKEGLARQALDAEGRTYVDKAKSDGVSLEFDHTQLIAITGEGSDTDQSSTGERSHKSWGTAVGYLFVRA